MHKLFVYRIAIFVILALTITSSILYASPQLLSFSIIALSLGLRHGLDADHIVAIDNITRKLAIEHKPSNTTGLYFALGHSTIVFCLTLLVILGIKDSHQFYSMLSRLGDHIGSIISISFLLLTLGMNLIAFKTLDNLQNNSQKYTGFMFALANKYLFNAVNKPKKMFLVGFFFGLGFDTATEVGLLSMTATSLVHGVNIIFILLLPILFACGMSFTDTVNSIFMSRIYNWVRQRNMKLYMYNYLILCFATLVTLIVAGIEVISYINEYKPSNSFLASIATALNDNSEIFGLVIASIFMLFGISLYLKLNRNLK